MKKLIVLFCFICIALGHWRESKEITLSKGIQVKDLTISNTGEIWILSSNSITKYKSDEDKPIYIKDSENSKFLAVYDQEVYAIDAANHLSLFNLLKDGTKTNPDISFTIPGKITMATAHNEPLVLVQDANRLLFIFDEQEAGIVDLEADNVSIIAYADYADNQTPFYTLKNNQIYLWSGGTYINTANYHKKLVYSSSDNIIDFTVDRSGMLYLLFADSIIISEPDNETYTKVSIDNLPARSRILINPTNNDLVLYNSKRNTLKILKNTQTKNNREPIILKNNKPNPVDNFTDIEFTINQPLNLAITIYNLIGEPVKVIAQGKYPKGTHHAQWNAKDEKGNLVPNGIYFYRLESNKGVAIKQLIVLR